MHSDHTRYMRRCLELARLAKENRKTAVGSLLVNNHEVISEGIEGSDELPFPLAHAEVIAIFKAITVLGKKDLSECTLYTTVEPCFMCSYLIRETKIKHIVFGVDAGEIGGANSNYPILTAQDIAKWSASPMITSGVLKNECKELLCH